ncbi:unnamed protein product, partial [Gadus morhua 'NCC']
PWGELRDSLGEREVGQGSLERKLCHHWANPTDLLVTGIGGPSAARRNHGDLHEGGVSLQATAAVVIPEITALKRLLGRAADTDRGVGTAKATLLEAVQRRFKDIEKNPLYAVATAMDPRYKTCYFSAEVKDEVKRVLLNMLDTVDTSASKPTPDQPSGEPAAKRASQLLSVHAEILKESASNEEEILLGRPSSVQLHRYLSELPIKRSEDETAPPPRGTTTERHHHRESPPPRVTTTESHHHRESPPPRVTTTRVTTTERHHHRESPPPRVTTTERHHHREAPPPRGTTTERHHHREAPPRGTTERHRREAPPPRGTAAARHRRREAPPPRGTAAERHRRREAPPPRGTAAERHRRREAPPPRGTTAERHDRREAPPPRGTAAERHRRREAPPPRGTAAERHRRREAPPRVTTAERHDRREAPPPRGTTAERHHRREAPPPRGTTAARHQRCGAPSPQGGAVILIPFLRSSPKGTLTRARTELNPEYLDLRPRAELNPEYWTPCTPLSQRRVTFHLPDGSQESCSDSGLGEQEPSGSLLTHPLPLVQAHDQLYDQASPDKRTEADGNSDPNS